MTAKDLKGDLQDLHIAAAKELEVGGGRKAIIIFVPFRQLRDFHRIQPRLVRELEKKFRFLVLVIYCSFNVYSGRHVVIVGQRTILPVNAKQIRLC
jgi:small subunit ribosomal protein S7e